MYLMEFLSVSGMSFFKIYLTMEKETSYLKNRGSFGHVPFPVLTKLYITPKWTSLQKNLKGNILIIKKDSIE